MPTKRKKKVGLKWWIKADMALQAAKRGYVAVCIEQACHGERLERHLKPRSAARSIDAANHALLLGRCLMGEQIMDVSSAVDWLLSPSGNDHCPPINPEQLYLFGHSSGGSIAVYAGAVDTRIKGIIASGGVGFIRESIGKRRDSEGASVVPGILQWMETDDVVALCAPRPFIAVSGRYDHIFPFQGVKTVIDSAQRVYRAFGAADFLRAVSGPSGHQYYPDLTWDAVDGMFR